MVRMALLIAALIIVESTQWAVAGSLACTERKAAIRHLEGKYSELPAANGVTNTGGVLEVLTSEGGNSWTMLITMPNGKTCLIAAGQAWQSVPPEKVPGGGA